MMAKPTRATGPAGAWGWAAFVVVGLCALELLDLTLFGVVIPALALLGYLGSRRSGVVNGRSIDVRDVRVMASLYVVVVGAFWLAFQGFGVGDTLGLFLSFAGGMLAGVVVPIVYTVWLRGRPLASLGIGLHQLPRTVAFGVVFAAIQFALTLRRVALPPDGEDWVPLLVMALTVGMFESVFFRGFLQGRLCEMFGPGTGVGVAAALYAVYHVGYGMGAGEMLFLFGLGVLYAIAYQLTRNLLVLWPLLTPLGSFFNNLTAGEIELPWAAIFGFVDVAAVMVTVVVMALRRERKAQSEGLGSDKRVPAVLG
jgi:uncharacterized protein